MDNIVEEFGFKIARPNQTKHSEELENWLGDISESVLDPIHKELAKDFWTDDGERVKPKHRKIILDTLDKWLGKMGVEAKPKQVSIIGSITTYQYTDTSDIDVNVVIELSDEKRKELIKLLPNEMPLPDTKHPVNYYLAEDAGENVKKKDSAYDLLNDKWIKKPKLEDVKIPYSYVLEIAKFFMDGMDDRIAEYERDKKELELYKTYLEDKSIKIDVDEIKQVIEIKEIEIRADLDAINVALKMAKAFRGEAYEDDYEPNFLITIESANRDYSVNNLVYKTIERFGYLEKLTKYKKIREEVKEKDER